MNMQYDYSPSSPPQNYLVWSILATIFCCIPIGIVAIIFSAQVNSKWSSGDREGAVRASKNAKIWIWIAVAIGIISYIIGVIFGIAGSLFEMGMETFDF